VSFSPESGRPIGVWVVALCIAVEGLTFYGVAYESARDPENRPTTLGCAAIGTFLMYSAFALLSFHRTAWMPVLRRC
jgi:hypothetical protein